MGVTIDQLIKKLERSISSIKMRAFDDEDAEDLTELYTQMLHSGVSLCNDYKPRKRTSSLQLVANQEFYDGPDNILSITRYEWGRAQRKSLKPYDPAYPKKLPSVRLVWDDVPTIQISPAPTSGQITALGDQFMYDYRQKWIVSDDESKSNIDELDVPTLIKAASISVLREQAFYILGNGGNSSDTRHKSLLKLYEFELENFKRS